MTQVRSYVRGPELKRRQEAVIVELRLEKILRQLSREIGLAVDDNLGRDAQLAAFPWLAGLDWRWTV